MEISSYSYEHHLRLQNIFSSNLRSRVQSLEQCVCVNAHFAENILQLVIPLNARRTLYFLLARCADIRELREKQLDPKSDIYGLLSNTIAMHYN